MARLSRWLVAALATLIALTALAAGVVAWLVSASLVDADARLIADGVEGRVEIVRDRHGVPHVFAEADADVYFGLGYAHAQDRLWQMTMMRRTAEGRLSEIFGARTLRVDELMRRLDLAGLARASLAHQDEATRAMLSAYAAGVNARLRQLAAEPLGRGAPEFFLFEPAIAPWRPADSLAVAKLMGVQFTAHVEAEVLRARLSLTLPEARVEDLMPSVPGPGIAALPDYAAVVPGARPSLAAARPPEPLSSVRGAGLAGASNAFAAAPSRAARGGSLMANDPHLGLSAPAIWYLARLELSLGGVIGGTVPGMPTVLVGRSDALAWGLTAAYVDDQDVFIEQLDPDDPARHRTPEGWAPFAERPATIRVKDAEPVAITLRWSENGPVLPGHLFDLDAVTPEGHVAALAWTLLTPRDTSVAAARALMGARTIEEAIEAAALYNAPAQNLTLATRDRIAMVTAGAVPRRAPGHATEGRMPAPGWIARNRWRGVFEFADNPRFVDPEGGVVGHTNNKFVDRPFPRHVSHRWGDTHRIRRWARLMQARPVHTRDSLMEVQLDAVSPAARALLPLIGRELWFAEGAAPEGTVERRRRRALDLLAEWNGEMGEHRPEPLIYAAWLRALRDRLVRDELGPLASALGRPEPLFLERVFRDEDGAGAWCDVRPSEPREACADVARRALDDALVWIGEHHGPDLEALRWGDAHRAHHDHPVLGDVPGLGWLVNLRQDTPGGDHTLNRGATPGEGPEPFANVHAAGYRGVYDMADPDSSLYVIATGQSGHPLSRHYDDLGGLWRRGEYIPMSLDPALARAGAAGVTVIEPPDPR